MFALYTAATASTRTMALKTAEAFASDRDSQGNRFNGYEAVIYVAM